DMPVPSPETHPFLSHYQQGPNYHRTLRQIEEGRQKGLPGWEHGDPKDFFNPSEEHIREYLRLNDKTPDVAWVYTVVAVVLNILVIYDAIAGPAYALGTPPKVQVPPPAPALGEGAPP